MQSTIPRSPGRRDEKKAARRDAILAAATVSFLESGYAATSMSGLLQTLGGSKATLWGYFRSKEELFAAVVDEVTLSFRVDVVNTLLPDAETGDALRAFCAQLLKRLATPDAVGAWRLVAGEAGRFPEVGRVFRERVIQFTEEALTKFFKRKIEQRVLRDEDAAGMTHFLLSLCWGCQNKRAWGEAAELDPEIQAAAFATWFMRAFAHD